MWDVKRVKDLLNTMNDEDKVYFVLYEKTEAEEHIQENLNEGDEFQLSDDTWIGIVHGLNDSESINEEINYHWRLLLEQAYEETNKAKTEEKV
jgi:hypothetical protein